MHRALGPFLLAFALTLSTGALAQTLPYHADPTERDLVPNLASVPAIRFLTTADFPPFNYRDDKGELIGFNVDLAQAICTDLAIACTVQAWPWEQAPRALEDKQGDALIAGLAMDADNGQRFDFSSIYLMLPGRFVLRDADVAAFDPHALKNKRIGVRKGTAHAEFVKRYIPEAQLVELESEPAALEALSSGTVDAYFGDGLRAAMWLNSHPGCCGFAGEPYFRPDLFGPGLAIAVAPGRDLVRQAIDYSLGRLKRSGVYDELFLRWFPVSFY